MKKIVLTALSVLTLFAGEVSVDGFKDLPLSQREGVSIVKAYDHGSIYELELQMISNRGAQYTSAFVTKDKKAIIFGEAFDTQTMQPLNIPLDVVALKKDADLVFGSGKKEYFLFTDPECHYCNVFERSWPKIEKDVKLYVYYMPLSHHREAKSMTYYIMQQKTQEDKASVSIRMANGDKSYKSIKIDPIQKNIFDAKLLKTSALAQKMGVRGTPSLFDFEGNSVGWPSLVE